MKADRKPASPIARRPVPSHLSEGSDAAVVAALARGDDRALDELLGRYGTRIQGYLDRILHDGTWADDLVQEVFVRVYQNAATYDPKWSVGVWIFSIARNLAVDLMRREGRRRTRLAELATEVVEPSTSRMVEGYEFLALVDDAIADLPEAFGSVFLLRDREGLSYEEIAAVLGISVKTVSSRLHRARTQLRKSLERYLG